MKQNIYDNKKFNEEYDKMRNENKGTNANDVIEIPIFRSLLPDLKEKTILDLGCGYGENEIYFKNKKAKYVLGTDISTHMIEIANKNTQEGIEYKIIPMEEIEKINKKFDLVVSSLAFHYIENFDKLIKDIYNLLNENGYLIFSQEHPITSCIIYDNNLESKHIDINNKRYTLIKDYNREGMRIHHWNNCDVKKYYRNISTIINTLVKNNFVIEELNECKPTDEMIEKNQKYINQFDAPYFLFIKAKKGYKK
jgi:SAM-dependent methyltransferase